jgi:glycine/D-amino acid oxidase-like deaminating enzyme
MLRVTVGSFPRRSFYRHFSAVDSPVLPSDVQVCIIGGGVIGCSVAYHLAQLGWSDIVLLERGRLSSGTTWHAAGLIGQLRDTETETKLSGVYGAKLLQNLEFETGLSTGFKPCGSLTLATCKDRLSQLKIRAAKARSFGIESHIISPHEALDMFPYLHNDDILAALWLPGDGSAISSDVTQALARGARIHSSNNVRFIENCAVLGISSETPHGRGIPRVTGVQTSLGNMKCNIIVNTAGLWARQVGAMCGVSVPLCSAEHFYIYSRPLQPTPVPSMLPILRDPDAYIYYREWSGGLLMGGFEPQAKPVFDGVDGPPSDFQFSLLPEDWDHFEVLMRGALHRTPVLQTAEVKIHLKIKLTHCISFSLSSFIPPPSPFACLGENDQRAGEFHPRQPVHIRGGPGGQGVLCSSWIQLIRCVLISCERRRGDYIYMFLCVCRHRVVWWGR